MQYPNGQIYSQSENNETTYFYPDGTIKTKIEKKRDLFHGLIQLYWPNGKIKRKTTFDNGVRIADEYYAP
jgi:antitoxin component YwqK of YwqJK toxin-antitoxin module